MKRDLRYWWRRLTLGEYWRYKKGTGDEWSMLVPYASAKALAINPKFGTGRIRYEESIHEGGRLPLIEEAW
jgi:hypothetical protein